MDFLIHEKQFMPAFEADISHQCQTELKLWGCERLFGANEFSARKFSDRFPQLKQIK